MKFRTLLIAAVAPVAAASIANATAVIGATEPTQILNNVELGISGGAELDQLIQQVAMVKNQIEAYKLMLQNIKSAPTFDWPAAADLLSQLHDLTTKGQSFAYAGSNSAEVFEKAHPAYSEAGSLTSTELKDRYKQWDEEVRESATISLEALTKDKEAIKEQQDLLKSLQKMNTDVEGQKAAIQIGNDYAAMLNDQLISLRYLMHMQIQQQQVALQNENTKDVTDKARTAAQTKATRTQKTYKSKL